MCRGENKVNAVCNSTGTCTRYQCLAGRDIDAKGFFAKYRFAKIDGSVSLCRMGQGRRCDINYIYRIIVDQAIHGRCSPQHS